MSPEETHPSRGRSVRRSDYFVFMALLLFAVVVFKTYEQYQTMKKTQAELLLEEGESLSNFTLAFRQTCQKAFAHYRIPLDNRTIHLLPVMTIDPIARNLSQKVNGLIEIRTVSDRPRNPANLANPFEKKMIDYFRNHPDEKRKFVNRGDSIYYVRAMRIEPSCLKCHGKREKAPKAIRDRYAESYDYALGEIRGLSSIRIVKKGIGQQLMNDFLIATAVMGLLYILLLIGLWWLIRKMGEMERNYARDLEREVEVKTWEVAKQRDVFETLFEKSSDGIFILENGKIVQSNEKIISMLRLKSKAELNGKSPIEFSPEFQPDGTPSREKGQAMLERAEADGFYAFECLHERGDGTPIMVDASITSITLDRRKVMYVIWRDITEKKAAEAKLLEQKDALEHQANHDALTNLPNRLLLMDRLTQGLKRAYGNQSSLTVLFIDIDNFKKINDSLGHHIGDKVLIHIAERFSAILREEDTLARIGGDEFTVLAECSDNEKFATRLAGEILALFREPIRMEGYTLHLSASIGISFYPQDAETAYDLLKHADAAMYKAKNDGKNTYRFYSPEMTRLLIDRVTMEEEFRQALASEQFRLMYQPQVDGVTGRVTGVEALIRWEHPERGVVMPDRFIPLAEETGLIVEIDRWVLRTAMRQVCAWRDVGIDPGVLSLNLEAQQLMSDAFAPFLKAEMEAVDFRPEWLELEVIEREIMIDPERSVERLSTLSDMGIAIAIDDFGTGYSSLSYLKQLPVDRLKIDRMFVQGVMTDPNDASITKAVIALARSLNLEVIAEGVETREQANFLIQHGCRHIQGYLYGRPMSADEIVSMFGEPTEQSSTSVLREGDTKV